MNRFPAPRNRRRLLIGCAIVATAAVPAVGQSAPADYIYWTPDNGTAIGRVANQAGATPNASFIPGLSSPRGITLLGSRLYWLQGGGIGRAYTDGTDKQPNFVTISTVSDAIFAGRPCSAAASCDSYLYYGQEVGMSHQVVRRTIDGTSPTTIIPTSTLGSTKPYGLGYLSGTANAAGNIFVSWQGFPSGTGVGYLQSGTWDNPRWTGPSMGTPGMAVGWGPTGPAGESYVYVANGQDITRLRAGCSGGGPSCYVSSFVSGASSGSGVYGIAVDDTYIYWINKNTGSGGNDSIGRVSLDGTTGKDPNFIPLGQEAFGIAVGNSSGGGGDSGGGSNTGGGTGGSASGGTSSSGASGSSSTSGGGSSASNTFTARKGSVSGEAITTRVAVPGPGRLIQRGTRPARASMAHAVGRVTACTGARTVAKAGTVAITCRLNAATRAARRSGAVTMRVATTFTPTGGTARTTSQVVVLPKISVRRSAVAG